MATIAEIEEQQIPRGLRWAIGTVGFVSPDGAAGLGGNPLRSSLTGLMTVHNAALKRLLPERVHEFVREQTWGDVIRGAARAAFNAALTEAREARAADLRHMEPALAVDPARAVEIRTGWRGVDEATLARMVQTADLETLTSVVGDGNLVPILDDPLWNEALRRFRHENRLLKENVASRYPAAATVDDPLVTGPDMNAARAEVETWEKAHAGRLEAVEANKATAQQLIHFLAAVYDLPASQVLDAILGRENA